MLHVTLLLEIDQDQKNMGVDEVSNLKQTVCQTVPTSDYDKTQTITVYHIPPIEPNAKVIQASGLFTPSQYADTHVMSADSIRTVLKTPDWKKGDKPHPWGNKLGIQPGHTATISNARVGSNEQIRSNEVNGKPVLNFSTATSDGIAILSGDQSPEPCWVDVAVWGDRATNLQPKISKGRSIQYASGDLTFRLWGDDNERCTLTLRGNTIILGRAAQYAPSDEEEAPDSDEVPEVSEAPDSGEAPEAPEAPEVDYSDLPEAV